MKRLIPVIFMLFLVSVPISQVFGIANLSDYRLSPALHAGIYVQYNVLGHPTVQTMRMTVLGTIVNSTSLVVINVTLNKLDGSSVSRLQLITVKGGTDDLVTLPVRQGKNIVYLTASSQISLTDQTFTVKFPIISPYLNIMDFLNVDERNLLQQNSVGVFIGSTGGDVWNYTFRHQLADTIQNQNLRASWSWDAETGLLTKMFSSNSLPYELTLSSTNAWNTPIGSIYKPITMILLVWNAFMVIMSLIGNYGRLLWVWCYLRYFMDGCKIMLRIKKL